MGHETMSESRAGGAPPSILCQGLPPCLLGPWGIVGPRASLPVSLGPLERGCRGGEAKEAMCLLPLGALMG